MNKWSLICSTFLGTINLLHFTPLFVFISSRYHYHILVVLPSHFSSMEQMLMFMLMLMYIANTFIIKITRYATVFFLIFLWTLLCNILYTANMSVHPININIWWSIEIKWDGKKLKYDMITRWGYTNKSVKWRWFRVPIKLNKLRTTWHEWNEGEW